jgi:hypothetical protein
LAAMHRNPGSFSQALSVVKLSVVKLATMNDF